MRITQPSVNVGAIWSYGTRTLTTSQFPFWLSSAGTQYVTKSISASSSDFITIKPNSGETWLVIAYANFPVVAQNSELQMIYGDPSQTNLYYAVKHKHYGADGNDFLNATFVGILNDNWYLYVLGDNESATPVTLTVVYTYFRLA